MKQFTSHQVSRQSSQTNRRPIPVNESLSAEEIDGEHEELGGAVLQARGRLAVVGRHRERAAEHDGDLVGGVADGLGSVPAGDLND